MVYDVFDCTFECVGNHLCFSINLAATKGIDGRLWCELMSSDKYRNFTQLKGNKSAHHFFIQVRSIFKHKSFQLKYLRQEINRILTSFSPFFQCPCCSSPCQNGGICTPKYKDDTFECLCKTGFTGKHCQRRRKCLTFLTCSTMEQLLGKSSTSGTILESVLLAPLTHNIYCQEPIILKLHRSYFHQFQ